MPCCVMGADSSACRGPAYYNVCIDRVAFEHLLSVELTDPQAAFAAKQHLDPFLIHPEIR